MTEGRELRENKDEEEKKKETEVFDGGVDSVAAVEEELNEPWPNVAAAACYTHHFSFSLAHPCRSNLTQHELTTLIFIFHFLKYNNDNFKKWTIGQLYPQKKIKK